ncbi:MAG: GHKL domain-containing protein [Carnobacterium inhibens]|uniref:GHKL domain-containing protein n=1 Tax=Carnobacterium inhibens TaxID=147709 RepID=UPI003314B5CB
MLYIDTDAYILRMILSLVMLLTIFFLLYNRNIIVWKKILILFIGTPLIFLVQVFIGNFADIILVIGIYFFINGRKKVDYYLINSLLASLIALYCTASLVSFCILPMVSFEEIHGFPYITIELSIQVFFLAILLLIYQRYKLERFLKGMGSRRVALIGSYLYSVILFFLYIVQYFNAYENLISGIMLFIVIQTFFVVLIFMKEKKKQKENYDRRLVTEQLKNLKMYTDQLEENQKKLRKFKHDYRNLVLSLRTTLTEQPNNIRQALDLFEEYTNTYMNQDYLWQFNDLGNIRNPYLKSLLISKLSLISKLKIDCHFECKDVIDEIPIHIFDLVRLLGISFDNAIEESQRVRSGKILILIFQGSIQQEFTIRNRINKQKLSLVTLKQEGYTTKQDHSGLGLVNIQEIRKKYSNLFVNYKMDEDYFTVQLVLTDKGEK